MVTVGDLIIQLQALDPALPIGKVDGFRGFTFDEINLVEVKVDLAIANLVSSTPNWRYAAHPRRFIYAIEKRLVDAIAID